jgi:hypothetical protein
MSFLFKTKSDGNGGSNVNRTPLQLKTILLLAGALWGVLVWYTNQAVAYSQLKKDVVSVCSESKHTKAKVDSLYTDIAVVKNDVQWIRGFMERKR